jgi:hypothetical protein
MIKLMGYHHFTIIIPKCVEYWLDQNKTSQKYGYLCRKWILALAQDKEKKLNNYVSFRVRYQRKQEDCTSHGNRMIDRMEACYVYFSTESIYSNLILVP